MSSRPASVLIIGSGPVVIGQAAEFDYAGTQACRALKAEGYPFTVSTPSGSVRLTSEHGRDDYIELVLDTSGEAPTVLGRVHRTRGSRTVSEEHPVSPGTAPAAVTDEQLLTFLMRALEPWLER